MKKEEYREVEEHFEVLRKKKTFNPLAWLLLVIAGLMTVIISHFGLPDSKKSAHKDASPALQYYFPPSEEVPDGALAIRTRVDVGKKIMPEKFEQVYVYGHTAELYIYPEINIKVVIGENSYRLPVVVNRKGEVNFLVRLSGEISNIEKVDKFFIDTPQFKAMYFNVPVKNGVAKFPPIIYYY